MRLDKVDLSGLARNIAEDLRKAQPERRGEFVIADDLVAQGDERLVGILLQNLLGNAWKYTARHPDAQIEFGLTSYDAAPAYFVRDNGAGFDMVYADKLFRPFQRLHGPEDFPGTGIGLALVERIIQRHGGRVWAEGEVEKGATFYFTLNRGLPPHKFTPMPGVHQSFQRGARSTHCLPARKRNIKL
jgi:light-regulated signal transduction histidine kinase (bacteriophytochrome)